MQTPSHQKSQQTARRPYGTPSRILKGPSNTVALLGLAIEVLKGKKIHLNKSYFYLLTYPHYAKKAIHHTLTRIGLMLNISGAGFNLLARIQHDLLPLKQNTLPNSL